MRPHRPGAWTTGCIIRVTAASPAREPIGIGAVRCGIPPPRGQGGLFLNPFTTNTSS